MGGGLRERGRRRVIGRSGRHGRNRGRCRVVVEGAGAEEVVEGVGGTGLFGGMRMSYGGAAMVCSDGNRASTLACSRRDSVYLPLRHIDWLGFEHRCSRRRFEPPPLLSPDEIRASHLPAPPHRPPLRPDLISVFDWRHVIWGDAPSAVRPPIQAFGSLKWVSNVGDSLKLLVF